MNLRLCLPTCLSTCVGLYVCLSESVYVCMYVCICLISLYVCMSVCPYVCMFVCLSVCVCAYVCVCTRVCVYVCLCVCVHKCLYVCISYARTHACMHARIEVGTYIYVCFYLLHLPRLHDFPQGVQAQSLEARCKLARWGWDFIDFNLSILAILRSKGWIEKVTKGEQMKGALTPNAKKVRGRVHDRLSESPKWQNLPHNMANGCRRRRWREACH